MNELDKAYDKYVKKENSIKSTRTLNSTEDNCIIDSITRQITIPESLKIAGVMADNNTKRIFFKCNKTAQITDLSKLNVCINYLNANNEADRYHCTDVEVINEYLTFSWLISNFATKYKGNITFVVCMYSDDMEEHWNSTLATLRVLEGLETTETITEQNPDIFEEILSKMESIKETGKQVEDHVAKTKVYADNAKQSADSAEELETNVKQYVIDAEQSAVKAKEEADKAISANREKLDKNQGTENEGKTIIVDKAGNLVPGEALPKNIYTKEEVDYLLADKMDKPYQSISISDNITLNDCLEGNFKIDSIEGNCYQDSLENVSPSLEKNIPIINKKINITVPQENVFNLQTESNTDLIREEGTYKSIAVHQLKPNTEYKIGFESVNVPAKSNLTLRIKNNSGTVICNIYTFFNMENTPKKEAGTENIFVTDSTGNISFEYNCMVNLSSTVETYREYWYTKLTKDITLVEDTEPAEEIVELRSLKESVNLFDLNLISKTELISKTGAYRNIDIPLRLKPNKQYTFAYDPWEVPAFSWVVLNIGAEDGKGLAGVFNLNNQGKSEVSPQPAKNTVFTTSSTGYVYFNYFVSGDNVTHASLWFTKLLNNIMLVEGTTVPSEYIPCAIKDYKIVDHVNKKAWIERHVIQKNLADLTPQKVEHTKFIVTYVYTIIPSGKDGSWNNIFCNNFAVYPYIGFPADIKEGIHVSNYGIYVVLDDKRNITTIGEYNEWIKSNPIIVNYQLSTSNIEEIVYTENDVSEFGVSSQDSTSPSLGIPSEIEKIDVLNIKTCAKNLLPSVYREKEVGSALWTFNGNSLAIKGTSGYRAIDWISGEELTVVGSQAQIKDFYKDKILFNYKGKMKFSMESKINNITDDPNFAFTVEVVNDDLKNSIVYSVAQNGWVSSSYVLDIENCIRGIYVKVWYTGKNRDYEMQNMQLEFGAIATEYEPYQESSIIHQLKEPLLSLADRSYRDFIDSNNRTNLLDVHTFTGKEIFSNDYQTYGYYGRFYPITNAKGNIQQKVLCNILPYFGGSWSMAQESCCQNSNQLHLKFSNSRLGITDNTPIEEKRVAFSNYIENLYEKGTPIQFVYLLENPTTEPLEPVLVEKIKQLKTYGSVTHVIITGKVKPTVNAKYPQDVAVTTKNLKEEIAKLTETAGILSNQLLATQSAVIESDIDNLIGDIKDE